jgi:hypothetical protein
MIKKQLKDRYDIWIKSPVSHDPAEFIATAADAHNTSVEVIGEILTTCDWFIVQ